MDLVSKVESITGRVRGEKKEWVSRGPCTFEMMTQILKDKLFKRKLRFR
jgi:hypothetical protein